MIKIKNTIFSFYDFRKTKNINNDYFLICDHGSNKIPNIYKNLGLNENILNTHIAYDIGAREVTIDIARKMFAQCFVSNFSRLIIDPNRKVIDDDLIVKNSFGINIPKNKNISKKEKNLRINKFYNKYHEGLNHILEKKYNNGIKLISIHSFTKETKTENRPTELGLLWNRNIQFMVSIKKKLLKMHVNVGNNKPYSGFFYNYTLDQHSKKFSNKSITIEIRNDLICNKKGIKRWSRLINETFIKIRNEK